MGPGTVTTASIAGASFGFALLWAIAFSTAATIVLQEMAGRLGLVSRQGLGEAFERASRTPTVRLAAIVLMISAIAARTNLGMVLSGLFIPRIPEGSLVSVIALIRTTVVLYNLFLHFNSVQEKWLDKSSVRPSFAAFGLSR